MDLPPDAKAALDKAVARLQTLLGENLYSLVLYGSAVRGNFVAGKSDLNLLLVLNESTPEAHVAIGEALRGPDRINPLVLGRRGIERSVQAFALKFRSIKRSYRVLHGTDPLAIDVDPKFLRFLCEQALRNRRLRLVHAFIVLDPKRYAQQVISAVPSLFTELAEVLRVEGTEVPAGFHDRIPILEKAFDARAPVLNELLDLRSKPRDLSAEETKNLHAQVYRLLSHVIVWIESRWPK